MWSLPTIQYWLQEYRYTGLLFTRNVLCWYTGFPLLTLFFGFWIKLYVPSSAAKVAPAKVISEQGQL